MAEEPKKPTPPVDPEAFSEEVLLASDYTTPPIEDDPQQPGKRTKPAPRTPEPGRGGILRGLLTVIGKPEKRLVAAYRTSGLHALLRRRWLWYQNLDDNQALDQDLESTYGARYGSAIHQFVRHNVLFTLFALAGLAVAAQMASTYLLPDAVDANRPAAPVAATAPPASPRKTGAAAPDQPTDAVLQHCAVTPLARYTLYAAPTDVQEAAIFEISRFRNRIEESGIAGWYGEAMRKSVAIEQTAQNLLDVTRAYANQLGALQAQLEATRSRLRARLDQIRVTQTRDSVATVNQQIQLRNELSSVNDRIARGPSRHARRELVAALDRLERALASESGERLSNREKLWLYEIEQLDAQDLAQRLQQTLDEEVLGPIRKHTEASPAIQRYRLQVVTDTVNRLSALLHYYRTRPKEVLAQLQREQARVNQRLGALLNDRAQRDHMALDIKPCLDPVDQAQHRPTARQPSKKPAT